MNRIRQKCQGAFGSRCCDPMMGVPQVPDGYAVVGVDEVELPAVGGGTGEDRFPGAVVVERVIFARRAVAPVCWQRDHVEDGRGEVAEFFPLLMGDVEGHREGFEVDLGAGDCRADVEIHAAFQLRHTVGENQEVGIARGAEGGSVAVGVDVDDVAADGYVAGDGDAASPTGGTQAHVAMGKSFGFDHTADSLAETFAPVGGLADDVVEAASFRQRPN